MIKLLLYCTKTKPYLVRNESDKYWYIMQQFQLDTFKNVKTFNGKIVAECDYEVEKIYFKDGTMQQAELGVTGWRTNKLTEYELLEKSCLGYTELVNYIKEDSGYAIHIKNLHIFDKPKELNVFTTRKPKTYDTLVCDSCTEFDFDCKKCYYYYDYKQVRKAPQNMMKVYDRAGNCYIFISIQPQWLCKILNKEKDVEVRRVVLKEMLK